MRLAMVSASPINRNQNCKNITKTINHLAETILISLNKTEVGWYQKKREMVPENGKKKTP